MRHVLYTLFAIALVLSILFPTTTLVHADRPPKDKKSHWTSNSRLQSHAPSGRPGDYILTIGTERLNYLDALGEWQEINPQFWSTGGLGPWAVHSAGVDYSARIKSDIKAKDPVEFLFQGHQISLTPDDIRWTNTNGERSVIASPSTYPKFTTSSKSAIWESAYGERFELEFMTLNSRLEKRLIINSLPPDPPDRINDGSTIYLELRLEFSVSEGLEVWINGNEWDGTTTSTTDGFVEFKQIESGETVFGFSRARTYCLLEDADLLGIPLAETYTQLSMQGGKSYVSVMTPRNWLVEAPYPVAIDPSIDVVVAAADDDAHEYESTGEVESEGPSATYVQSRGSNYQPYAEYVGIRFVDSTIPNEAAITSAVVQIRSGGYDDPHTRISFQMAESPGSFVIGATTSDISNRATTTAYTDWDEQNVGAYTIQDTPDISSALQEVVDAYEVTAMVVIFEPLRVQVDRRLLIQSYEDPVESYRPRLQVEYTMPPRKVIIISRLLEPFDKPRYNNQITDFTPA